MRTITALFDSRPEAERAVTALVQDHGLDRDRLQIHAAAPREEMPHDALASLRALFLPDQDRALYGEGVRRGGTLVSADVPEALVGQVSEAFEQHGAVDLDAREAEWRAAGWTGAAPEDAAWTGGGGLIGGKAAGSSATPDGMPAVNPDAAEHGWTGGGSAIGSTAATRDAPEPVGIGATYAGTSYIGARSTEEDITKPINAGIASSPPVRPAGPAALAAAGAGSSTSALRNAAGDAARAAAMGNEGPGSGAGPAAGSAAAGEAPLPGRGAPAAGPARQAGAPQPGTARDAETIPLVEERLRIGKRDVSHGSVRVRSYVVETPVQEQVTLRQEHVQVQRRPVDRPLGAADGAGFQDRVIEATESAEEAVVEKEARVREEVVLRKTAGERTETLRDTLRHTEVEVEDDRRRNATPPGRDPSR